MLVNEIFSSIQGESLTAGFPTTFVRFTGCNLRCSYCDTKYSYFEGKEMTVKEVADKINESFCKHVCLTGGEPLLQEEMQELLDLIKDKIVSIETNGSVNLSLFHLHENQSFVSDVKVPSSSYADSMLFENFKILRKNDEIKFVIGNREDYEWSKNIINKCKPIATVTMSPIFGNISYETLVNWIMEDKLNVRFQLQLHKIVWSPDRRGV